MAPPMAADALGRPAFTIADLVGRDRWPGAPTPRSRSSRAPAGPRSPLAADGDNVDLGRALGADAVVLVADAGLGTINAVRLARRAVRRRSTRPLVVALNRYDADDDLHRRNHGWLAGDGSPARRPTAGRARRRARRHADPGRSGSDLAADVESRNPQ